MYRRIRLPRATRARVHLCWRAFKQQADAPGVDSSHLGCCSVAAACMCGMRCHDATAPQAAQPRRHNSGHREDGKRKRAIYMLRNLHTLSFLFSVTS